MSMFSGKLRRLGKLTGSLKDKKPKLHITITPLNDVPKVTLTPRGNFSGAWERAGQYFGGTARKLYIIYRFVAAHARILHRYSAKAGTAPAQEIEADSAVQARTSAFPTEHPAQEITAHSQLRTSVWVQLGAYNRAAAAYLANILTASLAKPVAAPGIMARYRKRMELEKKYKAEAAGSAIIESRYVRIYAGVEAPAITAPAEEMATDKCLALEVSAPTVAAPTTLGGIARTILTTYSAAPYAWFLTEYTNGTAHVYQCVSGVQSGNTVEIDMEAESVYWANAFAHDGTANLVFAQTEPQTSGELELI